MENLIDSASPLPKYYQVKELLKNDINSGKFKPGEAIPSNPSLMQKYAVSQNTVRQAILALVQKGMLYTDHGRGTFVSELNKIHKNGTKASALIGVLVPTIDHPFVYSDVVSSIESEAHAKGYNVILGNFQSDFVKMKKYIASFVEKNIDGIILVPCMANGSEKYEKMNTTLVRLLKKSSTPFVFFDGYLETINTSSVVTDNEKAGFILAEHLIKQGYKQIAFVKCSYITSVKDRIRGYRKALRQYGLDFNENMIVKDTASGINSLLNSDMNVDSIICAYDGLAIKAMDIVKKRGLGIPSDIGIAGFDDNAASLHTSIPLTSIRQPVSKIGKKAADLLFDNIEGKAKESEEVIFMKPELVVRASSLKKGAIQFTQN